MLTRLDSYRDVLDSVAQFGIPRTGTAHLLDVGTSEFIDCFEEEILDQLIDSGGGTCRIYEAVYGAGKTHLLDLLGTRALDRGMVVARIDLSQGITLSDWKGIVTNVTEKMVANIGGRHVKSFPRILEALGDANSGLGTLVRQGRFPHNGYAKAIATQLEGPAATLSMRTTKGRDLLEGYLVGDRVGALKLRAQGINGVSDPLSKRNAEQVLATMIHALSLVRVPGCLVLFDENERSLDVRGSRPSRSIRQSANLLRRLIDASVLGDMPRFVAVFAVLPGFLDRCAIAYPALSQRVSRPRVASEKFPWRWPVLELQNLAGFADAGEFAGKAVERMLEIVDDCCGRAENCREEMVTAAHEVLETNHSYGFRRPLMKRLATIALEEIEQ